MAIGFVANAGNRLPEQRRVVQHVPQYVTLCFLTVVTSPLCSMNEYINFIISRNNTIFLHNMYNVLHKLHVSAHFRPFSGCSFCLSSVVA